MDLLELTATPDTNQECPLCEAASFSKWRFDLLRCEGCGLVVDEAVWRPLINEEMEEEFFGDDRIWIQSRWIKFFEMLKNRRTMARLQGSVAHPATLLEVGVGSGSFLDYAAARGLTPAGCDLSATICRRVEHDTGVHMHCGDLDSFPERQFDFIVMNHVLEHVADPKALIAAARRRLKPGGVLHLAVPNVEAWEARLPGWNSYEPYHLLYFTRRTLQDCIKQAGLEVVDINTHESFSGWYLAIARTLMNKRPSDKGRQSGGKKTGGRNAIIEFCYRSTMVATGLFTLPLRRVQGALGKGDEIVVLAKHGSVR